MMRYYIYPSLFLVCAIHLFNSTLVAQDARTQLNTPEKLTPLLDKKIELDRKNSEKKLFTIQVHYGDYESATATLEEFETMFPTLPARLIFETPNYKIRTGSFATEREALEVLTRVKRVFKAAFVLKP